VVNVGEIVDDIRAREIPRKGWHYPRSACWYGEMLRQYLFVADQHGNDFGCYSTFTIHPALVRVGDGPLRDLIISLVFGGHWAFVENTADAIKERIDYLNRLNIYANDRFFVVWWWDGDGNLTVGELDHGAIVRAANNSDCKKDYTWIWIR